MKILLILRAAVFYKRKVTYIYIYMAKRIDFLLTIIFNVANLLYQRYMIKSIKSYVTTDIVMQYCIDQNPFKNFCPFIFSLILNSQYFVYVYNYYTVKIYFRVLFWGAT